MKALIWKFDIIVYRLFYWRWNNKLANNADIRKLFLDFLNSWEAIDREPAMGIGGNPPQLKEPKMGS